MTASITMIVVEINMITGMSVYDSAEIYETMLNITHIYQVP